MSHDYSCFIDTRGWDTDEDVETPSSSSYRMLARSLERNSKRYLDNNCKEAKKSQKRSIDFCRRPQLTANIHRQAGEKKELPPIAPINVLVVKTTDIDPKSKQGYDWRQKQRKYFKVNLLPWHKSQQNAQKEGDELRLKEINSKYQKIREHRQNKHSRRLYFQFKSREEMELATQNTIEKFLMQRQIKQNQQTKKIFCLPVLNK